MLSSAKVLFKAKVPQLEDALRAERLRCVARLVASPVCVAFMQQNGAHEWRQNLVEDLEHVKKAIPKLTKELSPYGDLSDWQSIWQQYPNQWRQLVHRFLDKRAKEPPAQDEKEDEPAEHLAC